MALVEEKVRNFIKNLEKLSMIQSEITKKGTTLFVSNYKAYQDFSEQKVKTEGTSEGTSEGISEAQYLKNEKKEKNNVCMPRARACTREEDRKAYGTFSNVFLTDDEHLELGDELPELDNAIDSFSLWLKEKPPKYGVGSYPQFLRWYVKHEWKKEKTEDSRKSKFNDFSQRDTDYDALFEDGMGESSAREEE